MKPARSTFGLALMATIPTALVFAATLSTVQAKPKGKATASPHANAQPKPVQKDLPQVQPVELPKKPASVSGKTEAVVALPDAPTSLVSKGSDVARRWITPVLHSGLENEEQGPSLGIPKLAEALWWKRTMIWLMNPDTKESVRVRIICHNGDGTVTGQAEHTVAAMSFIQVPPAWDTKGSNNQSIWCRIDAPRPVVAYGDFVHYRRDPKSYSERTVPFFKAEP